MSIGYSFDKVLVLCAVLFSCTPIQAKECGYRPKKLGIINGQDAYENEFPWQISFRYHHKPSNTFRHFCGGTILSDYWMLTAAHCVDVYNNGTKIDVKIFRAVVGAHSQSKPSKNEQMIEVKDFYMHPDYDTNRNLNDVALVELSRPIGLNNTELNAICLGKPDYQPVGKPAVISGWGYTSNIFKSVPDILKRATVNVTDPNICQVIFPDITSQHVCAGGRSNTLPGDSGGPLQYEIDGRWYQLGIVSFGKAIAGLKILPGVFARVPYFLDFIKQVTGITPP